MCFVLLLSTVNNKLIVTQLCVKFQFKNLISEVALGFSLINIKRENFAQSSSVQKFHFYFKVTDLSLEIAVVTFKISLIKDVLN